MARFVARKPGFEKLKTLIASDPDESVRERAVQALDQPKTRRPRTW